MAILRFVLAFEGQGSALGNNAEIVLQILLRHPDACIGNRERAALFIRGNLHEIVFLVKYKIIVCQRFVVDFVNCVACIRNQLSQENFTLRIDGVDHHLEQPLGFRFKLLFRHELISLPI